MTNHNKISKALDYAIRYGGIDGDHHKAWVIDQIVRALCNCPIIEETASDIHGNDYTLTFQGENKEYKELIRQVCEGGHDWDVGITP